MILSMLDFYYPHAIVGYNILLHVEPGWNLLPCSGTCSQWLSTTTCWLTDFPLMESFVVGRSAAQKVYEVEYIYTWFGYKTQRSDCPQGWITFSCPPPPLPRASFHPSVLPPTASPLAVHPPPSCYLLPHPSPSLARAAPLSSNHLCQVEPGHQAFEDLKVI